MSPHDGFYSIELFIIFKIQQVNNQVAWCFFEAGVGKVGFMDTNK